jgi:hypothetical protein
MAHKICSRCKESKDETEFHLDAQRRGGRYSRCKACISEQNKARYKDNKEYYRQWHKRNKDKSFEYRLKYNYGMGIEEYTRLSTEQGGKCAICEVATNLVVDHCHATNKIRGLLCLDCNLMLGRAKDNPDTLQRGIEYLASFT